MAGGLLGRQHLRVHELLDHRVVLRHLRDLALVDAVAPAIAHVRHLRPPGVQEDGHHGRPRVERRAGAREIEHLAVGGDHGLA